MQMTEAEIVRSYQHALNRTKQISILAELNACSKAEIRDILEKNGEEVPHYGNRYTGKVKPETKKEPKRTSVRMSERRKKKSDSSDLSTRLLKSEESEDVGTCQQDVGTMSEVPEADGSERKQIDSSKMSPRIPEEVIAITTMKINDLKKEMGAIQEEMDKLRNELQERLKMCNRLSVWLDEVKKEGET